MKGKHSDAAFYDTTPAAVKASREASKWNAMYVQLVDNKASVWHNGQLIHDGVTLVKRTDSNRKTEKFSKAAFKLQGDHAKVWFTNLKIRPLPDSR